MDCGLTLLNMSEFCNNLHLVKGRDELVTKIKTAGLTRGFRLVLPYGYIQKVIYV